MKNKYKIICVFLILVINFTFAEAGLRVLSEEDKLAISVKKIKTLRKTLSSSLNDVQLINRLSGMYLTVLKNPHLNNSIMEQLMWSVMKTWPNDESKGIRFYMLLFWQVADEKIRYTMAYAMKRYGNIYGVDQANFMGQMMLHNNNKIYKLAYEYFGKESLRKVAAKYKKTVKHFKRNIENPRIYFTKKPTPFISIITKCGEITLFHFIKDRGNISSLYPAIFKFDKKFHYPPITKSDREAFKRSKKKKFIKRAYKIAQDAHLGSEDYAEKVYNGCTKGDKFYEKFIAFDFKKDALCFSNAVSMFKGRLPGISDPIARKFGACNGMSGIMRAFIHHVKFIRGPKPNRTRLKYLIEKALKFHANSCQADVQIPGYSSLHEICKNGPSFVKMFERFSIEYNQELVLRDTSQHVFRLLKLTTSAKQRRMTHRALMSIKKQVDAGFTAMLLYPYHAVLVTGYKIRKRRGKILSVKLQVADPNDLNRRGNVGVKFNSHYIEYERDGLPDKSTRPYFDITPESTHNSEEICDTETGRSESPYTIF